MTKVTHIISDNGLLVKLLLKSIGGILPPERGTIFIDGNDIYTNDFILQKKIRQKTSFVFENGGLLSNLSLEANLLLPINFHFPEISYDKKMQRINAYLNEFELDIDLSKRPAQIDIEIAKQIGFIRALLTEPEILIYDEPLRFTNSLGKRNVLRKITDCRNENCTQIIKNQSSFIFFKRADWIIEICENKLYFEGKPEDYLNFSNSTQKLKKGEDIETSI
ncbi:MAG: ATP-binding cassette domain-containing protein [bacterium]